MFLASQIAVSLGWDIYTCLSFYFVCYAFAVSRDEVGDIDVG
jgi:hypothetical protein